MGRILSRLRWKERSEFVQSGIILLLVIGGSLGIYGIVCISMGTPTPLVVVTSGSMEPNLYAGDLLLIQMKSAEDIQIWDIIVFQDKTWLNDTRIVHRVVDIQEINGTYHFTTKGDNNPDDDIGTRTNDEVIGVVVGRIPFLGNISLFLRNNIFIVITLLITVFLIVPEILDRQKTNTGNIDGEEN
ncbi:MAG: signal peptidase I [Candidatus Thorarchaeota archaeon]